MCTSASGQVSYLSVLLSAAPVASAPGRTQILFPILPEIRCLNFWTLRRLQRQVCTEKVTAWLHEVFQLLSQVQRMLNELQQLGQPPEEVMAQAASAVLLCDAVIHMA